MIFTYTNGNVIKDGFSYLLLPEGFKDKLGSKRNYLEFQSIDKKGNLGLTFRNFEKEIEEEYPTKSLYINVFELMTLYGTDDLNISIKNMKDEKLIKNLESSLKILRKIKKEDTPFSLIKYKKSGERSLSKKVENIKSIKNATSVKFISGDRSSKTNPFITMESAGKWIAEYFSGEVEVENKKVLYYMGSSPLIIVNNIVAAHTDFEEYPTVSSVFDENISSNTGLVRMWLK